MYYYSSSSAVILFLTEIVNTCCEASTESERSFHRGVFDVDGFQELFLEAWLFFLPPFAVTLCGGPSHLVLQAD